MRGLVTIYLAFIRVELAVKAHYRLNTLIWLMGLLIEPVIYLVVWSNVAQARGGSVGGYTAGDFTAYYVAFMVVRQFTIAPSPFRISRRIRTGEMSAMLMRPMHPVHEDFAEVNSQKFVSFVPMLLICAGVLVLFQVRFEPPLWSIIAFVPALMLAGVLRFVFQWALSLVAFWTTQVEGIWMTYVTLQSFLGGALAPLVLLPPALQMAAWVLPFRWIFNFPVEVLLGKLSAQDVVTGIIIQTLWVIGSAIGLQLIWRQALRRYAAVGG